MGGPFLVFAIHFVFQEVAFRKFALFEKKLCSQFKLMQRERNERRYL